MIAKWGGFIDDPGFDAGFFRIHPEAGRIDPTAAGSRGRGKRSRSSYRGGRLSGTEVSIGVSQSDYERIIYKETEGSRRSDGPGWPQPGREPARSR